MTSRQTALPLANVPEASDTAAIVNAAPRDTGHGRPVTTRPTLDGVGALQYW